MNEQAHSNVTPCGARFTGGSRAIASQPFARQYAHVEDVVAVVVAVTLDDAVSVLLDVCEEVPLSAYKEAA